MHLWRYKFKTGLDANNNGRLEDAEVITSQTRYVCNAANAIYSTWIDINASPVVGDGTELADELQWSFKQFITAPTLTADFVDKGIVLMYLKNSQGIVSLVDRDDVRPIRDVDGAAVYSVYCGYTFRANEVRFFMTDNRANTTSAEIRYVLIPGLTAGRTVADLKKMTYEEIAKLYNIK